MILKRSDWSAQATFMYDSVVHLEVIPFLDKSNEVCGHHSIKTVWSAVWAMVDILLEQATQVTFLSNTLVCLAKLFCSPSVWTTSCRPWPLKIWDSFIWRVAPVIQLSEFDPCQNLFLFIYPAFQTASGRERTPGVFIVRQSNCTHIAHQQSCVVDFVEKILSSFTNCKSVRSYWCRFTVMKHLVPSLPRDICQ